MQSSTPLTDAQECAGMALPVIVVQESIADKFVALLKKKAEAMKVGCSYDPETKLGPVVFQRHISRKYVTGFRKV